VGDVRGVPTIGVRRKPPRPARKASDKGGTQQQPAKEHTQTTSIYEEVEMDTTSMQQKSENIELKMAYDRTQR
jgi:hypothetical protein